MTNQCFFFFLSSISPAELYQSIYLSYIWQPDLICLLSASSGSQVKCCLAINNCDTDNLVPPDTGISICSCLPHRTSTFLLVIYMIVIVSTFHNKFGLLFFYLLSYTTGHHQTSPDMHQTPPDMH